MTVKQNKARYFNSIMPGVNHKWAAKALNMQINPDAGPDLIDSNKIVEIKFAVTPNQRNYIKWTVLEHQLNYETKHPNKKAFWGLGTYHLKQPPSTIKTKDPKELESLVVSRELFIVDWNWMDQFTSYHNQGETQQSKWDHNLRHPKKSLLPNVMKTHKVKKGLIHLTENIDKNYFLCLE
jgi:hypothetical protein